MKFSRVLVFVGVLAMVWLLYGLPITMMPEKYTMENTWAVSSFFSALSILFTGLIVGKFPQSGKSELLKFRFQTWVWGSVSTISLLISIGFWLKAILYELHTPWLGYYTANGFLVLGIVSWMYFLIRAKRIDEEIVLDSGSIPLRI